MLRKGLFVFGHFPAHFLFVFFGFQGSELFFLLMNLNYHFFIICLTLPVIVDSIIVILLINGQV